MTHPGAQIRSQLDWLLNYSGGTPRRLAKLLQVEVATVNDWLSKNDDGLARVHGGSRDKIAAVCAQNGYRPAPAEHPTLWDPSLPYLVNLDRPIPTPLDLDDPPSTLATEIAGFSVRSPFGSGASVLTSTVSRIRYLARSGCDLLTAKTVRSKEHKGLHGLPNILACPDAALDPAGNKKQSVVVQELSPEFVPTNGMMNRYGMPCKAPEHWRVNFREALATLDPGQLLILSVVGTALANDPPKLLVGDFVDVAVMAWEAGARVIELNFSCPNCASREGSVYADPDLAGEICHRVAKAAPDARLLIKTGYLKRVGLERLVGATAEYVAGYSLINSVPAEVLKRGPDGATHPAFGVKGIEAGISGSPIRRHSMQCVENLLDILSREGALNKSVIAMGGVTSAEDVQTFLNLGATAVQATTAFLQDASFGEKVRESLVREQDSKAYEFEREIRRAHLVWSDAARQLGWLRNRDVAAAANAVWMNYRNGLELAQMPGPKRSVPKATLERFRAEIQQRMNGPQGSFFTS